jgi:phage repressor protein C with HTH and peptisase S24 domain
VQVFAGSFRGKVLFENPEFINPNAVRAYEKQKAAGVYERRKAQEQAAKDHKAALKPVADELSDQRVFAPDPDDDEPEDEGPAAVESDEDGGEGQSGTSSSEEDGDDEPDPDASMDEDEPDESD